MDLTSNCLKKFEDNKTIPNNSRADLVKYAFLKHLNNLVLTLRFPSTGAFKVFLIIAKTFKQKGVDLVILRKILQNHLLQWEQIPH